MMSSRPTAGEYGRDRQTRSTTMDVRCRSTADEPPSSGRIWNLRPNCWGFSASSCLMAPKPSPYNRSWGLFPGALPSRGPKVWARLTNGTARAFSYVERRRD